MPLYVDQGQADDLRANTAIAQAKDDWYTQTAPDRAVDQTRTDYYNTRAADDAIAQVRSDYYQQRAGVLGDVAVPSPTQSAGVTDAVPTAAPESAAVPSPPVAGTPPADSGPLPAPNDPVTTPLTVPADRQSQFGLGLSSADAMAFCGPTAALAFAKTYGRNPTVAEAKQLAQNVGWNPDQGMAGVQSEQKLLSSMGVQTKLENGVDWNHVASDVQNGNPVILDTPGHYYYVTGYDPQSGKFNVGTSGTDLRGGSVWMTADQINAMPQSHGGVRAALYADHPLAQGPSVAEGSPQPDFGTVAQDIGSKAKDVLNGVAGAVQAAATDPNAGPIGVTRSAVQGAVQPAFDAFANSGVNQFRRDVFPNVTEPNHPINQDDPLALVLATAAGGGEGRPLFGRGGVPGADVGRNPLPAATDPGNLMDALKQSIVNQGRKLGWSDDQIQEALSKVEPAAPEAAPAPQATVAESPVTPADTGQTAPPPQATQPVATGAPPVDAPPPGPPGDTPPGPPPQNEPYDNWALGAAAEAKRTLFSLSNFHPLTIVGDVAASPAGPQGAAKVLGAYVKGLGGAEVTLDPALADRMQAAGVNTQRGNPNIINATVQNPLARAAIQSAVTGGTSAVGTYGISKAAGASDEDAFDNAIAAGAIGAVLGPTAAPRMHDALWNNAVPLAKQLVFDAATRSGQTDEQAAMFTNNLLGGQNLTKIVGSPGAAAALRLGMMSPDWTISQLKLAGAGVKGTAKTLIPGMTPTGNEQLSRDWLIKTLAAYGLVTEAVQVALTGHSTLDNSPGHQFEVEVPGTGQSKSGKQENITGSLFPGNLQTILNLLSSRDLGSYVENRESGPLKAVVGLSSNQQYPGGPSIVPKGTTDPVQTRLDQAGYVTGSFAPIGITSPVEQQLYGAPLPVTALSLLGVNVGHNTGRQSVSSGAPPPTQALPTPGAPVPTVLTRSKPQNPYRRATATPVPQ